MRNQAIFTFLQVSIGGIASQARNDTDFYFSFANHRTFAPSDFLF